MTDNEREIQSILKRIHVTRLDMRVSLKNIRYQQDIVAQDNRELNEMKRQLYKLGWTGTTC